MRSDDDASNNLLLRSSPSPTSDTAWTSELELAATNTMTAHSHDAATGTGSLIGNQGDEGRMVPCRWKKKRMDASSCLIADAKIECKEG